MPPSGSNTPVIVHVFGRTDVGRTREHNEDAFVVADLTRGNATLQPEVRTHEVGDRGSLFMVADGMGGAAAGEIASAMAIEVVMREVSDALSAAEPPTDDEFAGAIKRATASANAAIHNYAAEHPEYRGMGTTATVAGVLGTTLFVAQVGDSRAYLVRDGVGRQITKDQSLMQKLIEAGEITEEEAEHSERRNIILQALGPEANIKVDLTHQPIRRGDVLVLCSDGLSGQVRGDEIARIVSEEGDLVAACKRMIDRANEQGGPDNITVITARFEGDGYADSEHDDEVRHRVFPLSNDTGPTPAAERVTPRSGTATTGSFEAAHRPASRIVTAEFVLPPEATSIPREEGMSRHMRGSLIAVALLMAFLALATWWVYHTAARVVQPRTTTSPAATQP